MKKKIAAVFAWPVLVFVGWLGTALSEKYSEALDQLDFDFDFE